MFPVGDSVGSIRMHCAAILAAVFGLFQYVPRIRGLSLVGLVRMPWRYVLGWDGSRMCPDVMPDRQTQKAPPETTGRASMVFVLCLVSCGVIGLPIHYEAE